MMARREQSQFDDALEDVESDLLNPKTHSSSGPTPYIQRNGHLSSRREMEEPEHDGTNGELPESDTAEEEVQEERTEDEWSSRHEDADEARIERKKPLAPEEDGQDEYGDTFFIDQGDTSIQGMGYGSSYQYSEGDDGTREGTEDSGQGQIRDDLTESDKDKDYLDDVTPENRGVVYDCDDQYEDSGVVDDNGMMDGEGGMQGYEAEEDNAEGEDRFEEVDIRYGYMDGGYVTERQTYSESHQYVENNPAYNGSEQDYEVDQEFREKGASFQEYTESDLPDHISASGDKSIEESREDEKYEHEENSKEHIDQFSDSEKLRLGEHSPMTSDYVIVDRDTLAPEENLRYAASDSAEADQEEQQLIQQEDYDHGNTGLDDKKSEFMTLDMLQDRLRNQRGESKLHPLRFDDRGEARDSGMTVPSSQDRLKTDHEKSIKGQGQLRKSPQPASSPVRDTKESRNKVPRRPAPGAAQSVQRIPAAVPSSNVVLQSPRDIAPVPHHKAPSPGRHGVENERGTTGKGETTSQRSSRPTAKAPREGGGMQESRVKTDSSKRITGGEKQRSMPLPGGAQPVSVLKSRLREELREMYEIEKNLASTSIQPEMDRTHNINPKKTGRGMESQRDGSLSNRHNAEYASVSSLSSSGSAKQTSPTHRMKHSQEPLSTREMSRSSSSSPEKMRSSRPGQREQPRNNSNANHLDLDAVVRRSRPTSRQHDPSKRYSYEIEEKSDATSGEVVFDDIAECGAYLDEKDSKPSPIKIKNRQGKSPSDDVDEFGARRRRNSYELANRSSSEDEENEAEVNQKTNNKDELGLLGSQGGNLLGSGPRGPGMNSSLLSQLAERELANLRNSYKKPQEEPQEGPQESQSTASDTSSTSSSTHHESKPPLPKLSPMEYDAVGFRLAGHAGIGESTLNLSATQTQQSHVEADQFSDAEEDGSEPVYQQQRPNTTITPSHSYEQDYSSPMYRKRPLEDYYQKTSPVSPEQYGQQQPDATPTEQVDVDAAMKEIHSTLSKSKLMKAPSFYTPEEIPVWIRQPDAARRYEEDQKKSRVLEDRRRRNEEMRRSHVQQRQEYMKRRDPQCYVRNEEEEDGEDEDKGLMSEPDQKMVAPDYTNRQRPKEPETMRAPDLPPTTGKIREGKLLIIDNVSSTQMRLS
ncbi:apoptotic chromatin condensation inducer in the nucleus-like [Lytechinus pictus]|uniref:apoptotic chromatin condensation inducer in the nucleus-like n=1 Tax=Lytechinus pictus TaxID=7653 RepID=UPI0030BA18F9